MLPQQGLPFQHYKRLMDSPDDHWKKLISRAPALEAALPSLVQEPLLASTMRQLGVDNHEVALKRAMLVLHHALGNLAVSKLFNVHVQETLAAVIELIHRTEENRMAQINIQVAVLCAAIERLCQMVGGDKPLNVMFHLLNEIPLTHNTHEILVTQLTQRFENHRRTLH